MSEDDCRRCDRATERTAALIVQLRKTARQLHEGLHHRTRSFFDCDDRRCREAAAVVRGVQDKNGRG